MDSRSLSLALLALALFACATPVDEIGPRRDAGHHDAGSADSGKGAGVDSGFEPGADASVPPPDASIPGCTFGHDDTCLDQDWFPPLVGNCQSDGTCKCGAEYFVNPATGRCRWGKCDPVAQDCPFSSPATSCNLPDGTTDYPFCGVPGTTADGAACNSGADCVRGSTCEIYPQVCRKMCDLKNPTCPAGQSCTPLWQRYGMPGLCL